MMDPQLPSRTLHDPATGRDVELVYAFPPRLFADQPDRGEGGASPSEILTRLTNRWRTLLFAAFLGAAIGLIIAFATPNYFTASATALPPGEKAAGGMLAQYAGLAAAAGIQLPGASASSVDAIMAILASRRLREPLIERFQLREYYSVSSRDEVLAALSADLGVRNDRKSNTITISVTNRNPQKAADIANAAAELLRVIYNEINQGTATRERIFLEGRVKQAEHDLGAAATVLAEFQAQRGAVEIESQTKATIEAIARFQGELIAQQIELKALLASAASPDNPRVQLLQEQVKAMTSEMQRLLGAGDETPGGGVFIGLSGLPELGIAYFERYRAVKKNEALLAALATQLEGARLNEIRTTEVVTIIDRAFVPERKSGPPRGQICFLAAILGLVAGCVTALWWPSLSRSRAGTSRV